MSPDPAPAPALFDPCSLPHDPFARAQAQAAELCALTGVEGFDLALVCGSGLSSVAAGLAPFAEVEMRDLGLPAPQVQGHSTRVLATRFAGRNVLVFTGRVHLYEGWSVEEHVASVRLAAACGVRRVLLTNAAASMHASWQPGSLVLISDHVNLSGHNPLSGPAGVSGGRSRFVDMTNAYSSRLRHLACSVLGDLPSGVYACMPGPSYETPAEIAMLRSMGVDLVGMSTVNETIAARHAGLEVLGLSLVTNLAAGMATGLDHAEVVAQGAASSGFLLDSVRSLLSVLATN